MKSASKLVPDLAVRSIAREIALAFSDLPEVVAVTLGGSHASGQANESSDIDLYVFAGSVIPVASRAALIEPRASRVELDNRFYETEDYWVEKESGVKVEAIHRDPGWLQGHLDDLLTNHTAQLGYSTSLWHSIVSAEPLYDCDGWFASLQERARTPYHEGLAKAIIIKNFALLRGSVAAHPEQLRLAVARNDLACAQHRVQALLASYFDILFALNHELHPGEKRLEAYARQLALKPQNMTEDLRGLLTEGDPNKLEGRVEALVERLSVLLAANGHT